MTTRRVVLSWAGGAAGLAVLGGCRLRGATGEPAAAPALPADLLFLTTTAGLAVLDAATAAPSLPGPAVLVTADLTRVVSVEPDASRIRLVTRDSRSAQVFSGGALRDRLEPRVVSPDGRLVALTTPAANPPAGGAPAANAPAGSAPATPYRPGGRERTTVVVAESGAERHRLDLPGNVEPEAFSPDGSALFVLDYLPPTQPDRYRVRAIDLTTGRFRPLLTRLKTVVPAGAEEEMRGEGRQAVYDARRRTLFTLYTHQPDHEHTRDLLSGGARADAPGVHAFVHTLQLELGIAYCIDLPAPFGEADPAGYTVVASPDGSALYVVDTHTGSLAHIDPDELTVTRVTRFATPRPTPGDAASAVVTADGGLVVAAGTGAISAPVASYSQTPQRETILPAPARGLALAGRDRLYVGQPDAVLAFDLAGGRQLARIPVAGLVALRAVMPTDR